MSEVQTGMTTISRQVSLADLRRAEAERLAAELADRMRREEEARRRALSQARSATERAHRELDTLRLRLDEAKRRLPDLTYTLRNLPELPVGGEVSEWQRHADQVAALVTKWSEEADAAVEVAEEVLRRRLRTQEAWRENDRLTSLHDAGIDQVTALRQALPDVTSASFSALSRPDRRASYEEIETVNQVLAKSIDRLRGEIRRLTNIGQSNQLLAQQIKAIAVPFELVLGERRLESWKIMVRKAHQDAFETELARQLAIAQWREDELAADLALTLTRIRTGIATPDATDWWGRLLQAFEARARQEAAQGMLNAAPCYLPPALAREWHCLAEQLEQVTFGRCPLTATLSRRYQRLHEESQRALNHAYVFAQAKAAIAECGLIVEEDVVDLIFDRQEAPHNVMAFSVPGFADRKVVFTMDSDGKTASLPLRFNDSEAEAEMVRDLEFDHEVCHRLTSALSSLSASGIKVDLTKEETGHPVLKASEFGIKLKPRRAQGTAAARSFAREE